MKRNSQVEDFATEDNLAQEEQKANRELETQDWNEERRASDLKHLQKLATDDLNQRSGTFANDPETQERKQRDIRCISLVDELLAEFNRPWHSINGMVYSGHPEQSMEEYKKRVRKVYGSLRGVKFCKAKNRCDAEACLLHYNGEKNVRTSGSL